MDDADFSELGESLIDPFEESLAQIEAEEAHRRFGAAMWDLGRGQMNMQVGDARLVRYVCGAIYATTDGGTIFRIVQGDGQGHELPVWDLKGMLAHLQDSIDPPTVMVLEHVDIDDEDD